MLIDLPIHQGETLMLVPGVDGNLTVRLSLETIKRAYCEYVTREVEARRARPAIFENACTSPQPARVAVTELEN